MIDVCVWSGLVRRGLADDISRCDDEAESVDGWVPARHDIGTMAV